MSEEKKDSEGIAEGLAYNPEPKENGDGNTSTQDTSGGGNGGSNGGGEVSKKESERWSFGKTFNEVASPFFMYSAGSTLFDTELQKYCSCQKDTFPILAFFCYMSYFVWSFDTSTINFLLDIIKAIRDARSDLNLDVKKYL
nr:hypothetical protein MACL_00001559 [Theileria orientalis]